MQHASPAISSQSRTRALIVWLASVLCAWTAVHALNLAFEIAARCSDTERFVWWTWAKVVAWLVPTALLVRCTAGTSPARWLGLDTLEGIGRTFWLAALWLTFQALGAHLRLPLIDVPPPEPNWTDLPGALLVAPLFEELMFRGAMLRTLRDQGSGRERAVFATSLAFAALHLPGWLARRGLDPTIAGSFVGIVGVGLLFSYLGWYARSLWAPVLLHALHNAWATGTMSSLLGQIRGDLH